MLVKIGVVILLIAVNAFFAASEVALLSLNEGKIKKDAEQGNKRAKRIKKLLEDPSQFLATIQIGITLAGFLASAFAAESFAGELVKLLLRLKIPVSEPVLTGITVAFITLLLSYFTLVFGELVPKRLAMQNPTKLAMQSISALHTLAKITKPFVKLLTVSTNFFISVFGGDPNHAGQMITEDEIIMMLDEGEEKGAIEEDEKEMIYNIFDFDYKVAEDIMTHRIQVLALPVEATIEDIVEFLSFPTFSRIPVYEESIDHIVGILYVKDLIPFINKKVDGTFHLRDIMRQPFYILETKRVDELLRDMKAKKVHMAIVMDEYGGTSGVVTIEDLLEEIVGNIFDEYDDNESSIEKLGNDHYLIDGKVAIKSVEELTGLKLPRSDYETFAGYVIDQLGYIPEEIEKPELTIEDWWIKIKAMNGRRITQLELKQKS